MKTLQDVRKKQLEKALRKNLGVSDAYLRGMSRAFKFTQLPAHNETVHKLPSSSSSSYKSSEHQLPAQQTQNEFNQLTFTDDIALE